MPVGELFEVRAEEWHPVMDPREAEEEMHTKEKRGALSWEEIEEGDKDDDEDEGEDEDDAPKPTSSAAAAKPPTATIAGLPTAPAITPAPAAEDDDDGGEDEDDKPKSSSTVQKNVTSVVPAPPAVSAPPTSTTASGDDDGDDDDDDDKKTTKSSSTITTTVSSSSTKQAQSTVTSTVQPTSTVPKPQSQTALTPTTLVTSVSTTGNIIGLPTSSQGSRNGATLSSSSSSTPTTVPSSATAGISDTSNNASTISAVVLAIIIGTFAVILPFAIFFFWRRKNKKRTSASNFTFVNPQSPVPAVYVAPETRTSIVNNPFSDSQALNFNAQERGEWRSRGVSGIGQRAKSVTRSGLSEEEVEWMTGRAKIINVGHIKGREVVEGKEVENEVDQVVEKVEVRKRESWEDAESLVMNEKSGRSVEGKERAESLIDEPTGRKEVELGAKEERRNNTKSVAF